MPETVSPKIPQFRTTLFYGPERSEHDSNVVYCVFNVKKRSWKGGVQVAVEIEQFQLSHLRSKANVDSWLLSALSHLPESERQDYVERGHDIFTQLICHLKLQLAIERGIRQENSQIAKDIYVRELEEVFQQSEPKVKADVLKELDVEPLPPEEMGRNTT